MCRQRYSSTDYVWNWIEGQGNQLLCWSPSLWWCSISEHLLLNSERIAALPGSQFQGSYNWWSWADKGLGMRDTSFLRDSTFLLSSVTRQLLICWLKILSSMMTHLLHWLAQKRTPISAENNHYCRSDSLPFKVFRFFWHPVPAGTRVSRLGIQYWFA